LLSSQKAISGHPIIPEFKAAMGPRTPTTTGSSLSPSAAWGWSLRMSPPESGSSSLAGHSNNWFSNSLSFSESLDLWIWALSRRSFSKLSENRLEKYNNGFCS
jgi:hypothetical protein